MEGYHETLLLGLLLGTLHVLEPIWVATLAKDLKTLALRAIARRDRERMLYRAPSRILLVVPIAPIGFGETAWVGGSWGYFLVPVVLLHARKYISTRRKSQLMHTRRHPQYLIARLEVFLKKPRAHSPAFQAFRSDIDNNNRTDITGYPSESNRDSVQAIGGKLHFPHYVLIIRSMPLGKTQDRIHVPGFSNAQVVNYCFKQYFV
jgi:hypothetical protein